ncbi:Tetratricopeptide repeat-containing protein [Reichenbachiella faecimaris]|uniref:Tetratricopeptide repeat-containing protein n=1 Tax=Reichenbachiella faecimaris TaxID=692418 RepID=A0A1W2GDN9_REIFA|nr:tetratricopeptide repeat protein [Reichenbachiella faecimaris]SMD34793.1 Tetratricopeptide repeat-containing protein [Reichenbachiella faecimaris]
MPSLVAAQNSNQVQLANEYYINGEVDKALDIYDKFSGNPQYIQQIHNNYLDILLSKGDFKSAEKHIKKARKYHPSNVYYQIDEGLLFQQMGETEKADKAFNETIENAKENKYLIGTTAQYFVSKQLTPYALKSYLQARKSHKDKNSYALELANIYRMMDMKSEMIEEYLVFATVRPSNLRYVKNILQNILQKEEDISNFKNILIDKVQRNPNEKIYPELLIWVNLQQNDFYGAFVQAKAVDKKFKTYGNRVMDIGNIALENNAYDNAIEIYTYVTETYPNSGNYISARRQIIRAREEKVKNDFPVAKQAIRELTYDYKQLILDIGVNAQTIEAFRSKALLHAFYLDELDSAVNILNEIIQAPRINPSLKAKSKLDLGDIYLLIDDPWEATLLYSQVEKDNKDSPIGYDAKLKNAQLNYFQGNFELAKSHLDILKLATTREIANDALSLSLLIQDNTALDSSDFVMKEFASIELMLFQNKKDSALLAFSQMLKKYPGHSLTDEIYWKMARINLELGDFENALLELQAILSGYPSDILGDDAMYLSAQIYQEHLHDSVKAMEIYKAFLITYPGSVYVAEARKRFRSLRGDDIN